MLTHCASYGLLPQPARVEWNPSAGLFYLHSAVHQDKQKLNNLNLEELRRVKKEMQLVGGSNLDVHMIPPDKKAEFTEEVDALIATKSIQA